MGAVRAFSKRHRWTDDQESYLRDQYASAEWVSLEAALGLPRRTIQCKANWLGLARIKREKRTADQVRAAKREGMARKRSNDPEASREYQRDWRSRHRDRLNGEFREAIEKRLFWGRALRLRGITAMDLWRLWKRQRGRCALSGRRLDRRAEIDHRLPRSRGGTDAISNLQWVTREANMAKRDLTEHEFQALCRDVAEWIGERIDEVDAWGSEIPQLRSQA